MDISDLQDNAAEVAALLKLLSNQNRLMIACTLMADELSVGELNREVPLSQSALSQHLAVLRNADMVATRREGQTIYYSLKNEQIKQLVIALKSIFCPG